MSLEDMLQAIMGGGAQQRQPSSPSSGGGLEDILGAIMGGGAVPQQSSGGGLEDILGAIMGGGAQQQSSAGAGGMMDIISAILGGGQTQAQASPIIEGVSGKTGLSQMIVQMILSFVMSKLLGGASGGASGLGGLLPGLGGEPASTQDEQIGQGLDLDGLLEQMSQDSSMADELAQQTGLDSQTAQQGLQEVLGALGAQRHAASPPKKSGLDGLLENW